MAQGSVNAWETLFLRARCVLETVPLEFDWSFGGGTVLMRRYRHRLSKDIDIFLTDPQLLGYLSPRLNPAAEALTPDYVEQANFVKLYFPEGEVDFVVSSPLTREPTALETILGRTVRVETDAEIIAKKVWHRASEFKARDLFDLALVAEREPEALVAAGEYLAARRRALLQCLDEREASLREDFAALAVLGYRPSYEACVRKVLDALGVERPPRAEQPRARYRVSPGVRVMTLTPMG
jgi:hypothetical protein